MSIHLEDNHQVLQWGGAFAVLGGLGYFVTLLFHGDLPDQTTEIALEHIANRPEWPFLKLALISSILLWVGAFVAITSSLSRGASWLLSRMALACLLIGAAVVVVEYSVLGYEVKRLADAWQTASGPERDQIRMTATTMFGMTRGMFHSFIAWMLGLPFFLLGLAIVLGRGYPQWLGWLAIIPATGAFASGTTRFLGYELVPFPVLYGGFVIPLTLWLALAGIVMWRRGARMRATNGRRSA